jgi:hypothetical protein
LARLFAARAAAFAGASGGRTNYYKDLSADYSTPEPVPKKQGDALIAQAERIIALKEPTLPDVGTGYTLEQIEQENKEWWPTHCEALRRGRGDLLTEEYRTELVYFCQDGCCCCSCALYAGFNKAVACFGMLNEVLGPACHHSRQWAGRVGLLALQGAAYKPDEAYPLDVLGAQTEGAISCRSRCRTQVTMVEVDLDDPGFTNPPSSSGRSMRKSAPPGSRPRRVGR